MTDKRQVVDARREEVVERRQQVTSELGKSAVRRRRSGPEVERGSDEYRKQ
jgi:hypothetical protein